MNHVTKLSPNLPVHMSDDWFEIANLDHFWIKRRFEILRKLWKYREGQKVAEIGCGHGLVLRQLADVYGIQCDGFDLNEPALLHAEAQYGRLFCYNIHDRNPSLQQAYDAIFLFDVIEHLEDDSGFIESVLFHLKPTGQLIVNVPAYQAFYSSYDRVVGHQRRYDIGMFRALCHNTKMRIISWTYWGLMYVPILFLRQQVMKGVADKDMIKGGFSPKSRLVNALMLLLGRLEWCPNHIAGTSLMAIFERDRTPPS